MCAYILDPRYYSISPWIRVWFTQRFGVRNLSEEMIQDKEKSQLRDCDSWTDIRYVFLGWEVGKVWSGPGLRKQIQWEVSWIHEEEISCQTESQRDSQRTLEEKLCSPEGSLPQPLTSSEKLAYHRELPQPQQSRLEPAEMFSPGDCTNYTPKYYVRKCLQIMLSYPSYRVVLFQSVLHAISRYNFCQLKIIKQNKTKMK